MKRLHGAMAVATVLAFGIGTSTVYTQQPGGRRGGGPPTYRLWWAAKAKPGQYGTNKPHIKLPDLKARHKDRSRPHQLFAATATDTRRHRGDVLDDVPRIRRARIPALRMEVRQPQCGFACRSHALRLHVRRHFSAGNRLQKSQPRHRLVFDHRFRMVALQNGVRTVAGAGQLRRGRPAAPLPVAVPRLYLVPLREAS